MKRIAVMFTVASLAVAAAQAAPAGEAGSAAFGPPAPTMLPLNGWGAAGYEDDDSDGVPNAIDNCTEIANPDQVDANGDGFGNLCDADLNNDCSIDLDDLALLQGRLFARHAPAYDLNGDQRVDLLDVGRLRSLFYQPPGPSGLVPVCDPHLRFGDI